MKASEGVLQHLNAILTIELTAVNQYFLHSKICQNWGFEGLAAKVREDSMEEMRDSEALIDRILDLEGLPNLQRLGSVKIGQTVSEQFTVALELERSAAQALKDGVAHCAGVSDFATQRMLAEMLAGEEEQIAWLESQVELINQVGPQNYLSTKINK